MTESIQKRLTVTFKDVAVQVASLGEDYGSTVASVVTDLIPSFGKTRPEPRVIYSVLCLYDRRKLTASDSTSYREYPAKYAPANWCVSSSEQTNLKYLHILLRCWYSVDLDQVLLACSRFFPILAESSKVYSETSSMVAQVRVKPSSSDIRL